MWPEIGKRPEWFSFKSRKSEMNAPGDAVPLPFNCSRLFGLRLLSQPTNRVRYARCIHCEDMRLLVPTSTETVGYSSANMAERLKD